MSQELTVELIKEKLATNDKWLESALLALYQCQTVDERDAVRVTTKNGRGFNSVDVEILSGFSQWVIKSTREPGLRLSEKQKAIARKKLVKYSKQLLAIAEEKAAQKANKAA